MTNEIERPRNCGECARMQKFHAIIDGVEYDGACPEFCTHVRNTDVCHPNVGMKKRSKAAMDAAEGNKEMKKKVLVIDDHYFMKGFVENFVSDVKVDHLYKLPWDESILANYDALVIDGQGIGNTTYKNGLEFCKSYDKPDGQAVVYCSGLRPSEDDCKLLEKIGIAVVIKGSNPEHLSSAIKFAKDKCHD